jgi:hypothetical protein
MAKSARLHELFAPAFRSSGSVRLALLLGRRILNADQQHESRAAQ